MRGVFFKNTQLYVIFTIESIAHYAGWNRTESIQLPFPCASLFVRKMDSSNSSSESGDCACDEVEEFEDLATEELEKGTISVYNRNGELWCPFCFAKKKVQYKYGELVQHAAGVARGKRGLEAAGKHKALLKYLKMHMSNMEEPPKERVVRLEQQTPISETTVRDEKLVWPWMGIIVNINNSVIVDGKRVGPGNNEIKSRFSRFNLKDVQTKWNYQGHLGVAILEFQKDMIGYGDAQDFERSFMEVGRCKRDWETKRISSEGPGKELYGWIANQQDYNKEDVIGKHLRNKGNLRTVAEVNTAWLQQNNQLVQNLDATIQNQNQMLQDSNRQVLSLQSMVAKTEKARHDAELARRCMEQLHKEELHAVEQEANRAMQMREDEIKKDQQKLIIELEKVQIRCNELEMQEVHNKTEQMKREKEINENETKMQLYRRIEDLYKAQEAKKLLLIKKQEGESNSLLVDQHKQQKLLVNRHRVEQEIQAVEAVLETKKLEANQGLEGISRMQTLEDKLEELKAHKEDLEELNKCLTYKERELNDEVQNAHKVAVKVLEKKGDEKHVGVKKMGDLDQEPWKVACKKKFKDSPDGWEVHFATAVSQWDERVRDVQWDPFKVIEVGEGHEWRLNDNDEKLIELREEYGEAVFDTVTTALEELQKYNASGRYPVPIPWNYIQNRKATLGEVIQFLGTEPAKRAGKRKRRA
ncbi:hypothetical protein KP509_17G024800 [Ceratopteris richardii]|uniref:Uncharacterized protein n=1 Tax=Ceratopteris richardii TaxID=49495 RepID=A0A8T2SXQ6_CERRI|nr:hypothetical protein KP509_17G024800 [Ceratopteris richardii]